MPKLSQVEIDVFVYQSAGVLQDPGNAYTTAKAAVDGIKHLFVDDDGSHVLRLTFWPPERGDDRMDLLITEATHGSVAP